MQLCPSCNTPLPDQASFCAHCGHALNAKDEQTPQTMDKSEPPGTQTMDEEQAEAQTFSAAPNTQQPDEDQSVEESMTPILSSPQDILAPTKISDAPRETRPASPDTSLPVPTGEDDGQTILAFPAFEEPPLPVEPTASNEQQNSESQTATSDTQSSPELLPAASDDPAAPETLLAASDAPAAPETLPATSDAPTALETLPTDSDAPTAPETLPVASDAPAAPETLLVASDAPAAPETLPDASDAPAAPETLPATSDAPASPETLPDASDAPAAPETLPATSDAPAAPETLPTDSDAPAAPETLPNASDAPAAPETLPDASNAPVALETLPATSDAPVSSKPLSVTSDSPASPPQKAPSPANVLNVANQKTRSLPSPSPKAASSYKDEIAEQETLLVPIVPKTLLHKPGTGEDYRGRQLDGNTNAQIRTVHSAQLPKPAPKPVRTIGALIWSLISPIFKRARDPEPENPGKPQPQFTLLGWLPVIALTSALGLFTTATAFNAARDNTSGAELYYWLGVGLIYIPVVVRLVMPYSSRAERVGLLCVATLCLFLTKVSLSPLYYSGYDEFLHWRTINDILSIGHLFTKNPLLPVSPFYPGLEIVASALSNISGMTSIQAGFTVVGASNLLTILSLFLIAELLSGSARLASITAVIYMANPHFLFFDTQFAYESLAIPLALVVMLAMTRYETLKDSRRWVMLVAWTVLLALDLTHHATNFVFEGLFLLWAIVYLFLRPLPLLRKSIVMPTVIVGLTLTATTIWVIGSIVISYFTSFFADISSEIAQDLGSAGSSSRQLFGGGAVVATPLWERLISLGSVGLITLAIPFLLLCFWRRYRRNTLVWVFAIIIVFYPVLQVLRLTTSGAEISDRASAFIFIAISFLGAVAIVQFWPVRRFNWRHSVVISAAILVLFMGGIILGEGIPPTFMPGPYEASADSRSIDAEGIQAALWSYTYLGPNKRMYTDRINQLLMSVYGDQYLVTKIGDNVDVTDVIFDPTVGPYEISRLKQGQVHYLAIDLRLSTQLPQDGFYYEQGESSTGPNGDTTAINRERLTKFDTVPQINRLYDSGNMVIYDTGGLINAPAVP